MILKEKENLSDNQIERLKSIQLKKQELIKNSKIFNKNGYQFNHMG